MYVAPKHSAARKRHPVRRRITGIAIATSATFVTGVSMSPTAQAAGSVWDRVAACESGGNWAINTGNGYYGGLQFSAATWKGFGGTAHASAASGASKAAQISTARRVLKVQGPGAWPVCSKRAGLTRANGGAATVVRAAAPVSRAAKRVVPRAVVRLDVDGRMGPKTTRAIQRWVGTAQTGVFGRTTVKALQRKVGASPDGVVGPRTIRAVQVKISVRRDGGRQLSATIVAALQRYLNQR